MTEHDERSAFESRLPVDPAYWSALAERITHSAEPVFAELRARQTWWNPFDRFGPALSIAASAAAIAVFLALPATDPPLAPAAQVPAAPAVSPADLIGNAFASQPGAPDVVTLMVLANEE
jgi:hypothetical protein